MYFPLSSPPHFFSPHPQTIPLLSLVFLCQQFSTASLPSLTLPLLSSPLLSSPLFSSLLLSSPFLPSSLPFPVLSSPPLQWADDYSNKQHHSVYKLPPGFRLCRTSPLSPLFTSLHVYNSHTHDDPAVTHSCALIGGLLTPPGKAVTRLL